MKYATSFLLIITCIVIVIARDKKSISPPEQLYQNYSEYEEKSIETRRFKHEDILPLINDLKKNSLFTVQQVGKSIEDRPLHLISVGSGDTDILFWSQMHGDEPTATAAIFDVLNFLQNPGNSLTDLRDNLLEHTTLHFLPMLNPDGAEAYQRRNAIDIDINRDALRLTSPESVTLKQVRDSLNPVFGFNLHDQSTYYTSGRNEKPATISFLAPAYDYEQSINDVRRNAMKLIVYLNSVMQNYIPEQVAKYSDAHEPRAFGDMIQKWGTSTVLIESGGYKDDPEKQYIRKLNFVMLISAADAIGQDAFHEQDIGNYFEIPENESSLHDVLIRNVKIERENELYKVDLAIRHGERDHEDHRTFSYRSRIADIGDLSINNGYREIDGEGLIARPGKVYKDTINTQSDLEQINPTDLLKEGYTDIVLNKEVFGENLRELNEQFPLNLVLTDSHNNSIRLGGIPNLILTDDQQIQYVIVNGFLFEVEKGDTKSIRNGIIYR